MKRPKQEEKTKEYEERICRQRKEHKGAEPCVSWGILNELCCKFQKPCFVFDFSQFVIFAYNASLVAKYFQNYKPDCNEIWQKCSLYMQQQSEPPKLDSKKNFSIYGCTS